MLDIEFIRSEPERVKEAVRSKRLQVDVDKLLAVDSSRRELTRRLGTLREQRNKLSNSFRSARSKDEAAALSDESRQIGAEIKKLEEQLLQVEAELKALMLTVPGIPLPGTPVGSTDADNQEVRRWGEPRKVDFPLRDHVELMAAHGWANFEGPRKFAGSRSYALTGGAVLLEMAILRLALEHVTATGFTPVSPPVMVRENAMEGTGFFPIGREDSYSIERDGLFLVGTSEVGLVSLHRDEILPADALPIRYAGISPCFRREAGAAGRDTRGLYRVHQFNKVEQVVLCANSPQVSDMEHERLLSNAEQILQKLELPYRVALACTGELGLGQVRKHEVETWMPSRNAYSETHSCSTLYDFQARRSNIRYRTPEGDIRFVHSLNNTAIATPRILIALLENHQEADGSIRIPAALRPYVGAEVLRPGADVAQKRG